MLPARWSLARPRVGKPVRNVLMVSLAVAWFSFPMTLAACASSSQSKRAESSSPDEAKPALDGSRQILFNGQRGGTLAVYDHGDFGHLDPGQSYSPLDYEIIYATQRPLFSFPPNGPTTAAPDLASGPALISDGGRTVTVHIRHGVRYSPPVGREVTSGDVAYAIERGSNPNVANPYFAAYFSYIVGAAGSSGGPISGIRTPNKYTITFDLTGPYGSFLVGALSLPLSSPVPKEFAAPLDQDKPTQYGAKYVVATGPYMLKADSTGRFQGIGYQPGKSATLVRNPNWKRTTDVVPAYLDQINISIGGDPNVIGRQVLTGHHAIQNDTPAGSIVSLAYQKYRNQLVLVPGTGEHYVALNNKQGPFADVDVRKALWAALDREAMIKADGGQWVAQVATHFIYPGSAGYAQSGGDQGPNVDYNNFPQGNPKVAAKYMKLANLTGGDSPSRYTVKVVGSTDDPAEKTAAIVNQAVHSLGFKTNFTLVAESVMYSKYCGAPTAEIDVCPSVGWIRDWADPQTLLDPTFAGYNIVSTNNSNWGQVSYQDRPKASGGRYTSGPLTPLDQALRAAETTVGAAGRAAAWAKVDDRLAAQAVAVPWAFDQQPNIESADVRGINDLWDQGEWDYAYTSLK